jgi:transcriptional regulator GlxA family with amidase domain
MTEPAPKTVAIFVFDGVEPLDAVGPFEVFLSAEDADGKALFDVFLVAETGASVAASGGLVMTPRHGFADMPDVDILLVPGGAGTRALAERTDIQAWLRRRQATTGLTLSVCTGAQLLASAGLLKGKQAATHWATYDWLKAIEPEIDLRAGARYVDNGDIVCSSGVSAGIDMSLYVVERLFGAATAAATARAMEYEYWPQGRVATPA